MEPNLFKYILKNSRREQLAILAVVAVSLLFYYASLDLPKTIVNAITKLAAHPDRVTTFMHIEIGLPGFLGGSSLVLFEGFRLGRVGYLVAICLLFLVFVVINNWFKVYINTAKGRLGERMLRRLRYELFDRVLRFPQAQFRKVKQAEIATMIKDEVEPLGGFIGDAFIQPAFLGGYALTALYFMLLQSVWLGLVAVAILLVQAVVIPRLRKKILRLGRQRQLTARALAGRIAEVVDGSVEIHTHDTSNYERADIVSRLATIYDIRFELYKRKFAVKGLNNFLAQVTPFTFYLLGGLLAFAGRVDLGIIVAVINAYKDLPGPVKELIDWDQQRQDVQIKYEQVVEQFEPEGMLPETLQALPAEPVAPLAGDIALNGVLVVDDNGVKLLDGVSATLPAGEQIALFGGPGSGVDTLMLTLARLAPLAAGSVNIGGQNLAGLPEAVTGRSFGYAGPEAYLFPVSVRENLLYGLKHAPLRPAAYDDAAQRDRVAAERESLRAGNPLVDIRADWLDHEAAGAEDPTELDARIVEVLSLVELDDDVYQFGLRGTIDPATQGELAERLVAARVELRTRLAEPALAALVEPFDAERYNKNMSVAENLLFGTPVGPEFQAENIAANAYVRKVLADNGLADTLADVGRQIAETMVELFADLPPGHPFFEQFSFISAEDLPEYRALLGRLGKGSLAALAPADRDRLVGLAFPYVEARHRLGLIDADLEGRLLEARRAFAANLPEELRGAVEFYDVSRYIGTASVQDNILFGRLVYGQAQAGLRIGRLIREVLDGLGLRIAVLRIGLDYQSGIAGKRLTTAQRQKVGLARALLKRPEYLIVNEATATLDAQAQARIMENVLAARRGKSVLWVIRHADEGARFERLLVMKEGRIAEQKRAEETPARKPGPVAEHAAS
ncbi:MAG: putative transport system ATP-binding protein [Rhodospirillaceae bacterium]|jgi:putative ABC transport system ATP-binding protein|nr:putative transport system ATP-binding protein [Rhodospirillaceae bacterium]